MSELKGLFGRKALIPFITVGDPDIASTEAFIRAMVDAGADIIDLGLPFADPVAEGALVQEADNRALAAGTNTDSLFEMAERLHADIGVRFIITSYLNPVFVYGADRFMERCVKAGILGLYVPDMPYEEKSELSAAADKHGVDLISAIAPAADGRIAMIASEAQGFTLVMTSPGTTCQGQCNDIAQLIGMVRGACDLPCVVDIAGVPEAEVETRIAVSDGIIIGTAVVGIIAEHGRDSAGPLSAYIGGLRARLDSA